MAILSVASSRLCPCSSIRLTDPGRMGVRYAALHPGWRTGKGSSRPQLVQTRRTGCGSLSPYRCPNWQAPQRNRGIVTLRPRIRTPWATRNHNTSWKQTESRLSIIQILI